jgi:hypothetical protein
MSKIIYGGKELRKVKLLNFKSSLLLWVSSISTGI